MALIPLIKNKTKDEIFDLWCEVTEADFKDGEYWVILGFRQDDWALSQIYKVSVNGSEDWFIFKYCYGFVDGGATAPHFINSIKNQPAFIPLRLIREKFDDDFVI